ncbi:MAG: hypothetical protein J6C56_02445 [Alistipes sp.]|nr:hypothetical protein [Alistipes sp.]
MTQRKDTYFEEEEVVVSKTRRMEPTTQQSESESKEDSDNEHLRSRIVREVVLVSSQEEDDEESDKEADEGADEEIGDGEQSGEEQERKPREKSLVQHIITGSLLTDGTVPYYRYFIAIAIMCFLSIMLTFMSLNTSNECRRKEKQITLLHERSVVKEEQRYGLSSKSAITERLKSYNIELVDLSNDSRLIE